MALKVQTLITNKSRTPYNAVTGRGRKVSIRGGETIKLPYDLFSVLGSMEQKEYTRLSAKGLIEVKTEVTTDENVLTIAPGGEVKISIHQEEPAKAPKQHLPPPANKTKPDMSANGVVASKGAEKLAMGLGATTESVAEKRIKEVEIKDGKVSDIYTPGTQVTKNPPQAVEEKSINIFPNGTTEASKYKEREVPDQDSISILNKWLAEKNWSAVYEYLKETYPKEFAETTKTAIKKCKTFEDLRTLLNI